MKVQSNAIAPMNLTFAIPKIINNCTKSEQHPILFDLLEASSKTTQLDDFVRFVAKTFGTVNEFFDGYDISKHSNMVRAAINQVQSPPIPGSTASAEDANIRCTTEVTKFAVERIFRTQNESNTTRLKSQRRNLSWNA